MHLHANSYKAEDAAKPKDNERQREKERNIFREENGSESRIS